MFDRKMQNDPRKAIPASGGTFLKKKRFNAWIAPAEPPRPTMGGYLVSFIYNRNSWNRISDSRE